MGEDSEPEVRRLKFAGRKQIFALFIVVILFVIISSFFYLSQKYPTSSPVTVAPELLASFNHPHARMEKEVIGFLPYWRMDDVKYLRYDLVSEVIYFSLTADKDGQFVKVVNNETDPGWRWWNSQKVKDLIARVQISGGKFSLTVAMQKNKTLDKFLIDKAAQQTLINNLVNEVKSKHLDGINIDFEYDGTPEPILREKFVEFNQNLVTTFRQQSPKTVLSIDFFPLSIRKPRLFDIPKLAPLFDRVIIMSYDFYASNSDTAGPIAPMNGFAEGKYLFDIITAFSDYLQYIPKEKLILGVPYYGYDWPVEEGPTIQSKTLEKNDGNGYPEVISYGRAKTFNQLKPEQCQWEVLAQETWCWYEDEETGVDRQVWVSDNKSVETKFNFAKAQDLAGVAIWTLGYDKEYPDLWEMIKVKFTNAK